MENIANEEEISRNNWGRSPRNDENDLLRMQVLSHSNVMPESSIMSEPMKNFMYSRTRLDQENDTNILDQKLKQLYNKPEKIEHKDVNQNDNKSRENLRGSFYNCDPDNMTLNDEIYFLINCLRKARNKEDNIEKNSPNI